MGVPDWFLTAAERDNPHTRIDAHLPDGAAWSTGNTVRPIVHGRPYLAELHERITGLRAGDRLYFTDWRGDPDQRLTDDPDSTLSAVLTAAAKRGVDVRGLLWRSHWRGLGFHAHRHRYLGEDIGEAGGECLRDMRVRPGGSHHQKFVVIRYADGRDDIAYLGGIDLCHSRRDDTEHQGDDQALDMHPAYGPRPPWHDVQVAIQGPAVFDVETTFRELWEDSLPLTMHPGRRLVSLFHGEDLSPDPLGDQAPPPAARPDGHACVQILRTFPKLFPIGYDFAPDGEYSVALGNAKAIKQARSLVYVEDQFLWSEEVGEHFATALRENPELRLVVVLPLVPEKGGFLEEPPQLYGRHLAMREILDAGGDRVAVFGLTNEAGLPVYVHSKACIIDDRWASVGSDNLNRRSWSTDSEIACSVLDDRLDTDRAPDDAFANQLRRELMAEHLGCAPEEVPNDPVELFDRMVSCAAALDAWYSEGGTDRVRGVRGLISTRLRPHRPGKKHRRRRAEAAARQWADRATEQRPPGRLRRLEPPRLTKGQLPWASVLYDRLHDPDGKVITPEEAPD